MRKITKKTLPFIIVGLLALGAVGAAAYVYYSRPSKQTGSSTVIPGNSDSTSSSDSSTTGGTKSTASTSPAPHPTLTSEGKPQSEATTPQTAGSLTVVITRASASTDGIAAKTNKVITGKCTFTFNGVSPQTVDLVDSQLGYSGCAGDGTGHSGATVKVTVAAGSESPYDTYGSPVN